MKHARQDYQERIIDSAAAIPSDEPVFVIRGQDKVGWMAVEAYANLAHAAGASAELVELCRAHAGEMRKWAALHGKIPDLPRKV